MLFMICFLFPHESGKIFKSNSRFFKIQTVHKAYILFYVFHRVGYIFGRLSPTFSSYKYYLQHQKLQKCKQEDDLKIQEIVSA